MGEIPMGQYKVEKKKYSMHSCILKLRLLVLPSGHHIVQRWVGDNSLSLSQFVAVFDIGQLLISAQRSRI